MQMQVPFLGMHATKVGNKNETTKKMLQKKYTFYSVHAPTTI